MGSPVDVQARIEAFERVLEAHITINDFERSIAHEIAPGNLYHDTDYCNYVKSHSDMQSACGRFDNGAIPQALQKRPQGVCKLCHGGVYELVVPILRGDELIGMIAAGPYREMGPNGATTLFPLVTSDETRIPVDRELHARLPETDEQTIRTRLELLRSLADTLRRRAEESTSIADADRDRVHRIMHIIGRRYQSNYGLTDLASELALSESRAGKVVREHFGKSFTRLLQEYRIEKVKHYLERTLIPVSEIAHLCGFENENYLYRLFKRFEGVTPLQHRKARQTAYRV